MFALWTYFNFNIAKQSNRTYSQVLQQKVESLMKRKILFNFSFSSIRNIICCQEDILQQDIYLFVRFTSFWRQKMLILFIKSISLQWYYVFVLFQKLLKGWLFFSLLRLRSISAYSYFLLSKIITNIIEEIRNMFQTEWTL